MLDENEYTCKKCNWTGPRWKMEAIDRVAVEIDADTGEKLSSSFRVDAACPNCGSMKFVFTQKDGKNETQSRRRPRQT